MFMLPANSNDHASQSEEYVPTAGGYPPLHFAVRRSNPFCNSQRRRVRREAEQASSLMEPLARTLQIPSDMDTEPHPRSTPPHDSRRRVRLARTRIASSHFTQIIFANVIVDLAVATLLARHRLSRSSLTRTTS